MIPPPHSGWRTLLLTATWLFSSSVHGQAEPAPRCGACWCVPSPGESCPSFSPGLRESFPDLWRQALRSFQNLDDTPTELEPAGCFPFDVNLDVSLYPQAGGPPCTQPTGVTDDTVCAFVFPNAGQDDESCNGRSYTVQTFANVTQAQATTTGTALIVHQGPCGVCSNGPDLAARAETLDEMNPVSILCASNYIVDPDKENRFENLVQCYVINIGLSAPCARLWAFFGQSNAALCPDFCVVDADNTIALNEPPPDCGLSECLACSANAFEAEFNQLAGLWKSPYNAGLLDSVAYPCDVFVRIMDESFDPCVGTAFQGFTEAPTMTPGSGGYRRPGPWSRASSLAWCVWLLWWWWWGSWQ